MRSIIAVNVTDSLSSVWERMLQEREHICLVTDNYGSFEGIVTMEDKLSRYWDLRSLTSETRP